METLLKTKDLSKNYYRGDIRVDALKSINVEINKGELTFIVGPSGSGKSTLLQIIGGLDSPNSGSIDINGKDLKNLSETDLSRFRRRNLGFVFQFFNLLNNLTALENVGLPLILDGVPWNDIEKRATDLLTELGLGDRLDHYPYQLSGGQMQRVAIGRSLISDPEMILADEPTGNLDSKSALEIMDLFKRLVKEKGQTIVMVTHSQELIKYADRVLYFKDGEIEKETRGEN
jgi:putative ABC transport system ATP-binding protein